MKQIFLIDLIICNIPFVVADIAYSNFIANNLEASVAIKFNFLGLAFIFAVSAVLLIFRDVIIGERSFGKIKVFSKGADVSLSGLENKCQSMHKNGESAEDIARFCLDFVGKTIEKMTEYALEKYGNLPLVYAGGVMSNSIIRKRITDKFDAFFAEPDFSCDNAAGVAILAVMKGEADG